MKDAASGSQTTTATSNSNQSGNTTTNEGLETGSDGIIGFPALGVSKDGLPNDSVIQRSVQRMMQFPEDRQRQSFVKTIQRHYGNKVATQVVQDYKANRGQLPPQEQPTPQSQSQSQSLHHPPNSNPVQRLVGFEFETWVPVRHANDNSKLNYKEPIYASDDATWEISADSSNMEFITIPFNEEAPDPEPEKARLKKSLDDMAGWIDKMKEGATARPAKARGERQSLIGDIRDFFTEVDATIGAGSGLEPEQATVVKNVYGLVKKASIAAINDFLTKRTPMPKQLIPAMDDYLKVVPLPFRETVSGERFAEIYVEMSKGILDGELRTEIEQRVAKEVVLPFTDFTKNPSGKELAVPKYQEVNDYRVTAAMQATGGVLLENIPELMKSIKTTRLEHLEDPPEEEDRGKSLSGMNEIEGDLLVEANSKAEAKAAELFDKDANTVHVKQFQGLLALVISYLLGGARQRTVWPYSKIIAPLMSHSRFSEMYDLLDKSAKRHFTIKNILAAAEMPNSGSTPLFAKGFGEKDGRSHLLGRDKEGRRHFIDSTVNRGPLRKDWILSIKKNKIDLMSSGGGSVAAADKIAYKDPKTDEVFFESHSGGASSLGNMPLSETDNLIILELRRLPKGQYYKGDWEKSAMIIFDLFRRIQVAKKEVAKSKEAEKGPEAEPKEEASLTTAATPSSLAPSSSSAEPSGSAEPSSPPESLPLVPLSLAPSLEPSSPSPSPPPEPAPSPSPSPALSLPPTPSPSSSPLSPLSSVSSSLTPSPALVQDDSSSSSS